MLLPVELVQESMGDRRNRKARHDQKYQPCIERVQASKHFTSIGSWRVYWPHPAQKHGGIQEGVSPWQLFKVNVSCHSEEERNKEQGECDCEVEKHSPDEPSARDWRIGFGLVHRH